MKFRFSLCTSQAFNLTPSTACHPSMASCCDQDKVYISEPSKRSSYAPSSLKPSNSFSRTMWSSQLAGLFLSSGISLTDFPPITPLAYQGGKTRGETSIVFKTKEMLKKYLQIDTKLMFILTANTQYPMFSCIATWKLSEHLGSCDNYSLNSWSSLGSILNSVNFEKTYLSCKLKQRGVYCWIASQ